MPKNKGVIFSGKNQFPDKKGINSEIRKLDSLIDRSHKTLLRIKAVFPFNFFTDEIFIDSNKISIVKRIFFWSGNVRSVAYEDIFQIATNYSLIFATLVVVDRFYQQNPLEVKYLWKKDALHARRVIQGLMIARKENIKLEDMPVKLVLDKIEELGKARERSSNGKF